MDNINKQIYLNRMRASMQEKLFWLSKIPEPINCVIDFGCADGELLSQIEDTGLQVKKLIGIDQNTEFLKLAKSKVSGDVSFYEDVGELYSFDNGYIDTAAYIKDEKNTVFNFSSVFHELFSFCDQKTIDNILFAATSCEYITIRDMLKPSMYGTKLTEEQINYIEGRKLSKSDAAAYNEFFADKPVNLDNYIQFRMKLMYCNNWESEIKEDYFSVDWNYIDNYFRKCGYELMYKNDYSNDYVAKKLNEPGLITHRQLIYKKVER